MGVCWGEHGSASVKRVTSLVNWVKSTPLVPLHVSDAPDRLDLRNLGSELSTVLVLPLFKQVLVASVAWVLIAHPADAEEGKKRHNNIKNKMRLSGSMTHKVDSRAALNPNRRHLLLVAVCVKAGDVVIYDLYLLPCEAGVFIKDNLVLLAVLREEDGVRLAGAAGWSTDDARVLQSYHFNWPECNNGVATPAVGPGIPARILPLLKHVLLPLTVGLLVSHPSEERDAHFCHYSQRPLPISLVCL